MKTRITEMFGIERPIMQGGMHYVGFAELAAKDPARWILIDGLEPKDTVEEKIFAAVVAHPSFTLLS